MCKEITEKTTDIISLKLIDENQIYYDIVTKNDVMLKIIEDIKIVANFDCSVLIEGETGVGKELIAAAIHKESNRKENNFVPINVAGIPKEIQESELFGYEKGTFTGAETKKEGLVKCSDKGTLFLDEIGDMPLNLQLSVLRVFGEKKVRKLGSNNFESLDIRIISATNRDIMEKIRKNEFREDLYYRLSGCTIQIPPLRERKEDIEILTPYFINHFKIKYNSNIKGFHKNILDKLKSYDWPGNIREFRDCIERAIIFCNGDQYIDESHLRIQKRQKEAINLTKDFIKDNFYQLSYQDALDFTDQVMIKKVLYESDFNILKASKKLGIGRNFLYKKIEKYKIEKNHL